MSDKAETRMTDHVAEDSAEALPSFWAYMPATVEALRARGGSATARELLDDVPARMGLSDAQQAIPHDPENDGRSEVA